MFQWLVLVGEHCRELSSIFNYELCSFPSALSESSSLPLQANKPILAYALWKSMNHNGNQAKMFNMFLMVAHYSIASHGLKDPYMIMCVTCMLIISNKDIALMFLFLMDTPMNFQQKMLSFDKNRDMFRGYSALHW